MPISRRRHSETLLRQSMLERAKTAAVAGDPAELTRRARAAARAAGGAFGTPAMREETNTAIMAKLKAIEGRLGLPPLAPVLISSEPVGDETEGLTAAGGVRETGA